MKFSLQIKARVIFEKDCLFVHKAEFKKLGKRALVITGKTSGTRSGVLQALESVFRETNIDHLVFDAVENNPTLENVATGGDVAKGFGADFVVGVGGGSPLDASKAIAVLATNDIPPLALYDNAFANQPLPVVAIPTTAGTGSEVTPYAILTRKDMQTKMSFGNEDTVPKIAFLDATYLESLPAEVAVHTAVDAFSHALEGYLNTRSTVASDIFAVQAIRIFGECLPHIQNANFSFEVREKLLYMSMLAGIVITHTGTTSAHSMGYSLTYFKGIPHGKATGLLLGEYLRRIYDAAQEKIDGVLKILGMVGIDSFIKCMSGLLPCKDQFTDEEFALYASLAAKQKNIRVNPLPLRECDLKEILERSFSPNRFHR